jgi:tape measure domain-containing protein
MSANTDALKLGMSIEFDEKSLNFLNKLLQQAQSYNQKFEKVNTAIKQHTDRLQQVESVSKRMVDSSSKLVSLQESINKSGRNTLATYRDISGNIVKIKTQYDQLDNVVNKTVVGTEKMSQNISQTGNSLTKLAGLAGLGFISKQMFDVEKSAVIAAAELEQITISMEIMLGNAAQAKKMVTDIYKMGAITPYESKDLLKSAKMMLQYGISSESVMKYLDQLSNIAGGSAEKLDRLSLAFSQVMSQGRLMGTELRQFTENGFNPLFGISEKTGISMKKLQEAMKNGQISAAMVAEAMKIATSEGGRFYQMNERMSQTLVGLWSTIRDTISITLAKIGEDFSKTVNLPEQLKNTISLIDRLTQKFLNLPAGVKSAIIIFTTLSTAILSLATVIGGLSIALGALNLSFAPFAITGGIILGISALAGYFSQLRNEAKLAALEIKNITDIQTAQDVLNQRKEAYEKKRSQVRNYEFTFNTPYEQLKRSITGEGNAFRPDYSGLEKAREEYEEAQRKFNELTKQTTQTSKITIPSFTGFNLDEADNNKIQRIKDTLTNELQAIENQSKYYAKLGVVYEGVTEKVQAYNNAVDRMSRIAPNESVLKEWTKELATLKPQEIIEQYNQKLKGLMVTYDANHDDIEYLTKLLKILEDTMKELSAIDPSNPKLKEMMEMYKAMAGVLGAKTGNTVDNTYPKWSIWDDEAKYVTSALDALSSSLYELGTAAGDAMASITNSISKNWDKGGFNWQGMASDMMAQGISQIVSGIFSSLAASRKVSNYNRNEESGYSVAETYKNYQEYEANRAKLKNLYKELGIDEATQGILTVIGTVVGGIIGGPAGGAVGAAIGGALGNMLGGLLGDTDSIQEKIEKLQEKLEATWGKLKESLGTSVDNLVSSLENAFSATTYYDFMQSFSSSLYEMTRTALIRGFMAGEAYQDLYKNLTDVITVAVLDGVLDASEIAAIKASGSVLSNQMSLLYQALGLLDSSFNMGNNSSSSTSTYTASASTPITNYFYTTIEAGVFMGDEEQARECALFFNRYVLAEGNRA